MIDILKYRQNHYNHYTTYDQYRIIMGFGPAAHSNAVSQLLDIMLVPCLSNYVTLTPSYSEIKGSS